MLEPTIIRQTATLTEWDGKQGYATADNGKTYPLNINNMEGDIFGSLPEKGERVELYLHQDERGETEFVTCRAMPSFDNQGGFAIPQPYANEGRKFYADYAKYKRLYWGMCGFNACCLAGFAYLQVANQADFLRYLGAFVYFSLQLLIVAYRWWRHARQPESPKYWRFSLNHNSLSFNHEYARGAPPNGRIDFANIKRISLKKSKVFRHHYWLIECGNPKWLKCKIALDSLNDHEFEQANLLLKQYLADYPEVSLCL